VRSQSANMVEHQPSRPDPQPGPGQVLRHPIDGGIGENKVTVEDVLEHAVLVRSICASAAGSRHPRGTGDRGAPGLGGALIAGRASSSVTRLSNRRRHVFPFTCAVTSTTVERPMGRGGVTFVSFDGR
jgi:hypothetical protein